MPAGIAVPLAPAVKLYGDWFGFAGEGCRYADAPDDEIVRGIGGGRG